MSTCLSFDPLILLNEALHLGDHCRLILSLAVCENDNMTPSLVVLFYLHASFLEVNVDDYHFTRLGDFIYVLLFLYHSDHSHGI